MDSSLVQSATYHYEIPVSAPVHISLPHQTSYCSKATPASLSFTAYMPRAGWDRQDLTNAIKPGQQVHEKTNRAAVDHRIRAAGRRYSHLGREAFHLRDLPQLDDNLTFATSGVCHEGAFNYQRGVIRRRHPMPLYEQRPLPAAAAGHRESPDAAREARKHATGPARSRRGIVKRNSEHTKRMMAQCWEGDTMTTVVCNAMAAAGYAAPRTACFT